VNPTNLLHRWSRVEAAPVSDLLSTLPDPDGYAWIHEGRGLVAWGTAARIEVPRGTDRFAESARDLTGVFEASKRSGGSIPLALGSFSFDPSGSSELVVPRAVLRSDGNDTHVDFSGDRPPAMQRSLLPAKIPRIRYAGSTISELAWIEAVDAAVAEIARGDLDKVVLARDLLVWAKAPFDRRLLAARLSVRFPECYTFIFGTLVGATPELLVRRAGRSIESLVLAGSARRGADNADDRAIGAALLESAKDNREHRFSVESVTDVLDRVCGGLSAEGPFLLKLANVQHIATRVTGTAAGDHSALEIAGLLHPTAAVCGAPRGAAMDAIRRLEHMERGRYSGPVGWVDANGDGEFGIALRCAEVDGTRARLFAGNGIVADSRPEAELEETRLKLRAMQDALSGG
jgi:menaquinone-specific isochorismate synthase